MYNNITLSKETTACFVKLLKPYIFAGNIINIYFFKKHIILDAVAHEFEKKTCGFLCERFFYIFVMKMMDY